MIKTLAACWVVATLLLNPSWPQSCFPKQHTGAQSSSAAHSGTVPSEQKFLVSLLGMFQQKQQMLNRNSNGSELMLLGN